MNTRRLTFVQTNHAVLDGVQAGDANLLLKFRTSPHAATLSPVSAGLDQQENYISSYLSRHKSGVETYFKICDRQNGNIVGLVRVFGLGPGPTFNWSSLLIARDCQPFLPIDVIVAVYSIGFEYFGKTTCGPFPVRSNARRVLKLHQSLGLTTIDRVDSDGTSFLSCDAETSMNRRNSYHSKGLGVINQVIFEY